MQKVVHKAESRGHANHGWLKSYHTFSFAGYHHPSRMHFGALRVLNDDLVDGGQGFGAHPHDNMEIVSIVLSGALEHKDNTGRNGIIKPGDVQIMSAGTGIVHSEYNADETEQVSFLQLWIFPNEHNIPPRYDQKFFDESGRKNKIQVVAAPANEDEGALIINQDAWLSRVNVLANNEINYDFHGNGHGVYIFVLEGSIEVEGEKLNKRDGAGFSDTSKITIQGAADAELLIVEVPMKY